MYKVSYLHTDGTTRDEVFLGEPSEFTQEIEARGGIVLKVAKARQNKVPLAQIVAYLNTTADFLSSGVSLSRAQERLTRSGNAALRDIAERCYKSILQGYSYSYTLGQMGLFSETVISMVKSGEESGKLAEGLYTAATYLEQMRGRTAEAMKKLSYPALLMVVASLSLVGNAFFIMPKLKDSEMVKVAGSANLAMYDRIELFGQTLAMLIPSMFVLLALFALAYRHNPEIVERIRLPFIKKLLLNQLYYTAFFNLYQLISSGVRLAMALEIVRNSSTNVIIRTEFDSALACLKRGENFANGFRHIEPEERDMLESAVNLDATERILKNIYVRYEREYLATLSRLVPILNTAGILLVLLTVGVLAFMLIATEATMLKDVMKM